MSSSNTIGGDGPWKYLDLLNECIKILMTIGLGYAFGYFKVFDTGTFVPQAVRFVFYVALPALVTRGLGIGVDFYDDDFLWNYIAMFLVLRAIALCGCLMMWAVSDIVKSSDQQQHGIGQVAVHWLSLTWISTVILGVPITRAVFGDPTKGAFYGILAAISSFMFQLPFQLLFLECHTLEQEYLADRRTQVEVQDEEAGRRCDNGDMDEVSISESDLIKYDDKDSQSESTHKSNEERRSGNNDDVVLRKKEDETNLTMLWTKFARRPGIWRRIVGKVLRNPVLWGIAIGFVLSLSTVGPTYLHPKSKDYVPGLGWIWTTCGWLGECVSPVSLFVMGVWMQEQKNLLCLIPLHHAGLYMLSKLVLMPLVMVGLAKAVDLNDEAGRAAVLIAALPISLASFSLGSQYKIGEAVLSENVALGTLLLLPTILVWNLVMDEVGLFDEYEVL